MTKISAIIGTIALGFFIATADAAKLKKRNYTSQSTEFGVVLMDVSWARQWSCAGYENAQLTSLYFEKVIPATEANNKFTEIHLKTSSRLSGNPAFISYGFLVEPGTYAFTAWSIKAAKTVSQVGHIKADRGLLVEGTKYLGGTFEVNSDEVVYVGNFFLDCLESPIPWRYYTEGQEGYDKHKKQFKSKYKFLKDKNIIYRLLETKSYGGPSPDKSPE